VQLGSPPVADWLNSSWLPVVGYGVVVVLAATIGRLESRRSLADREAGSWPAFWFTVALVALAMGVGRALHAGGLVAELGRGQVRSAGWYEDRRSLQIIVIGAVASLAVVIVLFGVARWWRRRTGYLALSLLMVALVCFSIVRVVSLHQVDSWMRTKRTAGVTFGTLLELGLLAAVIAIMFKRLRRSIGRRRRNPRRHRLNWRQPCRNVRRLQHVGRALIGGVSSMRERGASGGGPDASVQIRVHAGSSSCRR
jgi:hypothetical protein